MQNTAVESTARLPGLAILAALVAFLAALLTFLAAVADPLLAIYALIQIVAGVAMLRRQAWGAYGFALVQVSNAVFMFLIEVRDGTFRHAQPIVGLVIGLLLGVLFFFAGRSLAKSGAKRGPVIPWIIVACLVSIPFVFVKPFAMPSGSMEDTILLGDQILVRMFPRPSPNRGDIVVFHYPVDRSQIQMKRVIGISGDRIRIVSGVVYRNGVPLNEPYARHKLGAANRYANNFPSDPSALRMGLTEALARAADMFRNHVVNGEVVIPLGKYFVMGDNRDNSLDSRYWGFLDESDVMGKPVLIYNSVDWRYDESGTKATGIGRIRWNRIGKTVE